MSKGYITIAQNNSTVDYLEQAYALALSLKATQSTINKLSVCVDAPTMALIKPKHKRIFDKIIEMPWEDDSEDAEWKIHNKWKVYYCTPYDETVLLDSDMIFPTDVSYWWDTLSQRDFWATTKVYTYRGDIMTSDVFRKTFTGNHLPNIYNAFMYFKKSDLSTEIFKMATIIYRNWQRFYHLYLPEAKPNHVSGDVVFALAIKILGYEHLTTRENIDSLPTFVHMKGALQGVNNIANDWSNDIDSYLSQANNLVVGNFKQSLPFHYVDKNWITEEIIDLLEGELNVG